MKLICVEGNYTESPEVVDNQMTKKTVFFLKPDSSIVTRNRPFFLPDFSKDIRATMALLIRICKVGKHISEKFAHTYYDEVGLGVNMSAYDLQQQSIEKGEPWEIANCFDGSLAISNFVKKDNFKDINSINFQLRINDECVQQANSAFFTLEIDDFIVYVSQFMTLKMGDVICFGTFVTNEKLQINDKLQGFIETEKFLDFRIK